MESGGEDKKIWMRSLNAFLTTIVSVGMLTLAYAQWVVSEEQIRISDLFARLELAKATPLFKVNSSKDLVDIFSQENVPVLAFPNEISLHSVEQTRGIIKLNPSIIVSAFDKNGEFICDLEFRGLYKEVGNGLTAILRKIAQIS